MADILQPFLSGGIFVAVISYIGNKVDPILAGLLSGLPIPIVTTYFISDKKAPKYVLNLVFTGLLAQFVTILYYLLYDYKKGVSKNMGIIISMSIWFISVMIIFYYQKYK